MKTLTVRQPWAWAIAKGYKDVENRSRATSHRGPLAIHAGLQWDEPKDLWLRNAVSIARDQGHTLPAKLADDMPYADTGLVLAVVDVVGVCVASRWYPTLQCECGPWALPGETHWRLADARVLAEPFAAMGRLGLWDVDVPAELLATSGACS